MVTVISRFKVRNGMEEKVRKAFLDRPRLVESAPGFRGIEILTDATDSSVFMLLTRWTDEASYHAWHGSDAHHSSHKLIPKGLRLDAAFTSVVVVNDIQPPANLDDLRDAVASRSGAVSQWLIDSDVIFALLLAPDGAILSRNRAALRVFPPNPSNDPGQKMWDYLISSDVERLRERLSKFEDKENGSFLLNIASGQQSPVTWEVGLVCCGDSFLLMGTEEHRYDANFQTEILNLTNDLAMEMREAARKNRELQLANITIEQLARTDTLTGLANRWMLEESLPREVARAERMQEALSVVFIDLDRLKPINDDFGHLAGDQVLASLGKVFKSQLRPYSLAARLGGDEFILLLPGATKEGAIIVAERIREKVAAMSVPEAPRQITISLGVASWLPGETESDLLARADEALYRAKQKGGNRVEVA